MPIQADRDALTRIERAIADLRGKEATEVGKEADSTKKMNKALEQARRTTSPSSAKMFHNAADREAKNIEGAQSRRAAHAKTIAAKAKEASRVRERIAKGEADEAKRRLSAETKRQAEDVKRQTSSDRRIRELETLLAERTDTIPHFQPTIAPGETEVHDVFISHAWEDKADFVDDLAAKARAAGLSVWYDTFTVEWGQSLRQEIDRGLAGSYFGVVVLSPSFFAKPWPNYELDGLIQKDLDGSGRMLPIWHKLSHEDVKKHSPSLAGRLALNTTMSTDDIVTELVTLRDRLRIKIDTQIATGDKQDPATG